MESEREREICVASSCHMQLLVILESISVAFVAQSYKVTCRATDCKKGTQNKNSETCNNKKNKVKNEKMQTNICDLFMHFAAIYLTSRSRDFRRKPTVNRAKCLCKLALIYACVEKQINEFN